MPGFIVCILLMVVAVHNVPPAAQSTHFATTSEARKTIAPYDTKAVEWFFTDHMRYWRDYDERDDFRPTTETLALGYGDCDDFARVALEMVRLWPGCESKIIVYETGHNTGRFHAVTGMTCDNGLKGAWDNGEFIEGWTCPGEIYKRGTWDKL